MSTARLTRHENLLALIDQVGTIQALADKLGKSHSQISQLRNQVAHSATGRDRGIGDRLAREIESKLSLPEGWMDQSHGQADSKVVTGATKLARHLAKRMASLSADRLQRTYFLLDATLQAMEAEEAATKGAESHKVLSRKP